MIEAMLGLSKINIEQTYENKNPDNLLLIRANAERILDVFDENNQPKEYTQEEANDLRSELLNAFK